MERQPDSVAIHLPIHVTSSAELDEYRGTVPKMFIHFHHY
jgi:hypothetical protein